MSENKNSEEEEKKSSVSGIGDWALIFGVATTVVVAAGATAYMIKKKRDEELAVMRYGEKSTHQEQNLFQYTISSLSGYWKKAPSIFEQINVKMTSFLKSFGASNESPIQSGDVHLQVYEDE
tara:strand:- start:2122 stop:2487 length:366 start_codon:yes stop_codon:yes gene_type:complete